MRPKPLIATLSILYRLSLSDWLAIVTDTLRFGTAILCNK
ncbi:hypothetical protein VCJ_000296 [Vibrio metoecus]|nr:hypothetical protein VCJ_000296 [Vibrio metoecus]